MVNLRQPNSTVHFIIFQKNKKECLQNREKNTENYNPQLNSTIEKRLSVLYHLSATCFAII